MVKRIREWSGRSGTLLFVAVLLVALTACGTEGGNGSTPDANGTTEGTSAAGDPAASAPGVSSDSIKIGLHTPLTGPASFVGQGFELGAQLAVQEINENGGVNGRSLELSVIDDGGTPDGASAAVRRLVEQDNVFLVFGGSTSTATVPLMPYFESNPEIPYVALPSDPRITEEFRENVFSGGAPGQRDIVDAIAEYVLSQEDIESIHLMQCDQGHCQVGAPLLEEDLTNGGLDVTGISEYNSGDTDFTGQVNEILNASPDAVLIYGLAADGERIVRALRQAGYEGRLLGDPSLSDATVAQNAGEAVEGFVTFWIASPQYIDETSGAMGEWRERFDQAFPDAPEGTPNLYSLVSYGDAYAIAEGLRRAGDELTRSSFMAGLEALSGFVAGEDEQWSFAPPVMMPRTYGEDDHIGNTNVTPVVVVDGEFQAVE